MKKENNFFLFFQFSKLCDKNRDRQNAQHASQQIAWGVYFPKWGHLGGFVPSGHFMAFKTVIGSEE